MSGSLLLHSLYSNINLGVMRVFQSSAGCCPDPDRAKVWVWRGLLKRHRAGKCVFPSSRSFHVEDLGCSWGPPATPAFGAELCRVWCCQGHVWTSSLAMATEKPQPHVLTSAILCSLSITTLAYLQLNECTSPQI